MSPSINTEYYETSLVPLIQNNKLSSNELQQRLIPLMQEFFDELDEQDVLPDEIFDLWNTMLANLIITHGIRRQ